MINNYELVKTYDNKLVKIYDNDLENNLDTKSNLDTKNNIDQDNCSICLEKNNNTSIKLECGCNNKYHIKCINELKKHKFKKCPLCLKKISTNEVNEENDNIFIVFLKFILFILGCIYIINWFSISIIHPLSYIFNPSELKYCDNLYKKCEYYPVKAILFNNTINEKFNNFDIKYELKSSYEYYNGFENNICVDLELHEFKTYQEVLILSKKSIGIEKYIYVRFDEKNNCKLHYKFYNPIKFILNVLVLLNIIWYIPLMIINITINNFVIDNVNKYLKILLLTLRFIVMIIYFIIQFTYAYYWYIL